LLDITQTSPLIGTTGFVGHVMKFRAELFKAEQHVGKLGREPRCIGLQASRVVK
jgi:hypothetical protein